MFSTSKVHSRDINRSFVVNIVGRNIQNPKGSRKLTKYKIRIDEMLIYQVFIGCIGLNLARRKKGRKLYQALITLV